MSNDVLQQCHDIALNFRIFCSYKGENSTDLIDKSMTVSSVDRMKGGLINDTYLISISSDERYVLQRINTTVFSNVSNLMQNILKVTKYLQDKHKLENLSDDNCLVVIPTTDGKPWLDNSIEHGGGVWRMFNYIPNSTCFAIAPNGNILTEAGKAFGRFHRFLSDYPNPSELHETIPDFHNTPVRLQTFRKAVSENKVQRLSSIKEEVLFVENRASSLNRIVNMLEQGQLPKRLTHNDTKLENVLFNEETSKAICAIDYDTIMPNGTLLYDFGDAVRSTANTATEDEADLSLVRFNIENYRLFTHGFLEELGKSGKNGITDAERKMLPFSVILLTIELAMRFLTDYLDGDLYFKTNYESHNLVRARNQIKLVKDMERLEDEMSKIVNCNIVVSEN